MSDFFVKHSVENDRRKSKKVEELIQKYSLELYSYNKQYADDNNEEYLLLRDDFDKLIEDIRSIYISKNYQGMMSWLIDRAFLITPNIKSNNSSLKATINTNKSLLLKVLYDVNNETFLNCFVEKCVHRAISDDQKSA